MLYKIIIHIYVFKDEESVVKDSLPAENWKAISGRPSGEAEIAQSITHHCRKQIITKDVYRTIFFT